MFTAKKLLLLVGRHFAVALLAVIVSGLIIFFLAGKIQQISNSIALSHRLAASLDKRTALLSVLQRDSQIVGTNDVLIEKAFMSEDNIFEFVSTLERIALKNSTPHTIHFDTPSPSIVNSTFHLSTITYSNLLTTGSIFSFSNYLKDFERMPYFTKIESLHLSSQAEDGWYGTSTVSFRATLFTKKIQ